MLLHGDNLSGYGRQPSLHPDESPTYLQLGTSFAERVPDKIVTNLGSNEGERGEGVIEESWRSRKTPRLAWNKNDDSRNFGGQVQ